MAFCENCGAQLLETSKFCPECGTPVEISAPADKSDEIKAAVNETAVSEKISAQTTAEEKSDAPEERSDTAAQSIADKIIPEIHSAQNTIDEIINKAAKEVPKATEEIKTAESESISDAVGEVLTDIPIEDTSDEEILPDIPDIEEIEDTSDEEILTNILNIKKIKSSSDKEILPDIPDIEELGITSEQIMKIFGDIPDIKKIEVTSDAASADSQKKSASPVIEAPKNDAKKNNDDPFKKAQEKLEAEMKAEKEAAEKKAAEEKAAAAEKAEKATDSTPEITAEIPQNTTVEAAPKKKSKAGITVVIILLVLIGGAAALYFTGMLDAYLPTGMNTAPEVTTATTAVATDTAETITETAADTSATTSAETTAETTTASVTTVSELAEETTADTSASETDTSETSSSETDADIPLHTAEELTDGIILTPEHTAASGMAVTCEISLKESGIPNDILNDSVLILAEYSSPISQLNGVPVMMKLVINDTEIDVSPTSTADSIAIIEYANAIAAAADAGFTAEDIDVIRFTSTGAPIDVSSITFIAG